MLKVKSLGVSKPIIYKQNFKLIQIKSNSNSDNWAMKPVLNHLVPVNLRPRQFKMEKLEFLCNLPPGCKFFSFVI